MIRYRRPALKDELERADWRLRAQVHRAAELLETVGYDLVVTSVARSRERTLQLYREAGKEPPGISVHEVTPTRGCDSIPEPAGGARVAMRLAEVGPWLAERLCEEWVYPRGKSSAIWHDFAGAHIHQQVPWDGVMLAATKAG